MTGQETVRELRQVSELPLFMVSRDSPASSSSAVQRSLNRWSKRSLFQIRHTDTRLLLALLLACPLSGAYGIDPRRKAAVLQLFRRIFWPRMYRLAIFGCFGMWFTQT